MSDHKKRNKPQQEWNPHWSLKLLYGIWSGALGLVKIAAGAVATVLLICLVCGFVFVGILGDYLQSDILPEAYYDLESAVLDQTSFVYYVDGSGNIQLLQQIHTPADRQMARGDEIPEDLKNAAIAIEDKRFYEHQGVDWITTVKACANMFFGGDDKFGGSTITQQLLKNITGEDSVTVQRKVMEIFRAQQVEKNYDKDTILELYLNTIYLGRGCYGVKSAAAEYFGKELQMLTPAECASLISITNNPSIFNPFGSTFEWNPGDEQGRREMTAKERNRVRQVNTLWVMKEEGMLSQEVYEQALNQEMVFKSGIADEDRWTICEKKGCGYEGIASTYEKSGDSYICPVCGTRNNINSDSSQEVYSYFVDTVIEEVAADLAAQNGVDYDSLDKKGKMYWKDMIQRGGFHIYSTLDMEVQNAIDNVYNDPANVAKTRSNAQLQSAMVVIDNRSGDIVGMAGGVGKKTVHDGLNRATDSKLQTGSSQKPISVYAPAFEAGEITPATVVEDLPVSYSGGAFPKNDNRKYNYSRTIYAGIVNSVNAVAVRTLRMVGYDYAFEFAKEKFGLEHLTDFYETSSGKVLNDLGDSPLGMGALTVGATVREMAAAYATFANGGEFREARTYTKVYDSNGKLILDNTQDSRQILSEKTVTYMNYCLSNAVAGGTGYEARISGHEVAGKSGTTSSHRDRWFCGYTGYYTAAVWCGYDQPEVIKITSGENNPSAVLFKKVLNPLHKGKDKISLWSTKGMRNYTMCLDSFGYADDACSKDLRTHLFGTKRTATAYAFTGEGPEWGCSRHVLVDYCSGGGVATKYCAMFAAEEGSDVEISERALLKMTPKQVEEVKRANGAGLVDAYVDNRYVYYVSEGGDPLNWHGFDGKANKNIDAPYVVCPVHTEEAWEKYQESIATEPPTEPPTEAPEATPEETQSAD